MKRQTGKKGKRISALLEKYHGMTKEDVKKAAEKNYPTVESLRLSNEDMIPSNLYTLSHLHTLSILTDKRRLPKTLLCGMHQLRTVIINSNNIRDVTGIFQYCKLSYLILHCPSLKTFPSGWYSGVPYSLEVHGDFSKFPMHANDTPYRRLIVSSKKDFEVQDLGFNRDILSINLGKQGKDFTSLFKNPKTRYLISEPSHEFKTWFHEDAAMRVSFVTDQWLHKQNFLDVIETLRSGVFIQMRCEELTTMWQTYIQLYERLKVHFEWPEPVVPFDNTDWLICDDDVPIMDDLADLSNGPQLSEHLENALNDIKEYRLIVL